MLPVVLSQAWTLLWYKQFTYTWRQQSLRHTLGTIAMDIVVPACLVYVYLANALRDRDTRSVTNDVTIDPRHMRANMDTMMSNMLLPVAFFLFCRKLVGQIVHEKDSGMLEYLMMNGMSQMAYNISFILHEAFVSGPLICATLDSIVWYRLGGDKAPYTVGELLGFNVGIIIYVMGVAAFTLLISKAFKSAGFATQLGSLLYLVPVFMTLALKVLEMKHNFARTANRGFDPFRNAADERERREQAELRAKVGEGINDTKEEKQEKMK